MKKQLVATILLIIMPAFLVSCVSSLLKENPPKFSKEVKWLEPDNSFEKENLSVYPAWKSSKTGNVISIVSDCGEAAEAQSLGAIHQLIESSLEEFKLNKEQKVLFQSKAALLHFSQGELDGHPIEIQSMSFKRKACNYLTSLSGKKNNLESDRATFLKFNESLKFE